MGCVQVSSRSGVMPTFKLKIFSLNIGISSGGKPSLLLVSTVGKILRKNENFNQNLYSYPQIDKYFLNCIS